VLLRVHLPSVSYLYFFLCICVSLVIFFVFNLLFLKNLLGVPSYSKKQVTFGLAVPSNDLSQPYDLFHKSVHRGHLVGKSSSQTVPAHVVDDVIHVAKDHDSDVLAGGFNSPYHFTVVS